MTRSSPRPFGIYVHVSLPLLIENEFPNRNFTKTTPSLLKLIPNQDQPLRINIVCSEGQKDATPGIPVWSPTTVLTGLLPA